MNKGKLISAIIIVTTIFSVSAVPIACTGVAKQCTKDILYDKTIEGKKYSCYECKQTMCSSGGNSIVGTKKSSVCTEKTSASSAIKSLKKVSTFSSRAPVVKKGLKGHLKFDEADSLFGKRTNIKK